MTTYSLLRIHMLECREPETFNPTYIVFIRISTLEKRSQHFHRSCINSISNMHVNELKNKKMGINPKVIGRLIIGSLLALKWEERRCILITPLSPKDKTIYSNWCRFTQWLAYESWQEFQYAIETEDEYTIKKQYVV